MIHVGIIGVGHYAPARVLTNSDLEERLGISAESILQRTGIAKRHIADDAEATSDLATQAAQKALAAAGLSADELDFIIVTTTTPDCHGPATAAVVQANLKATKAAGCDIAAACSGFVYSLVLASQMIKGGLYKKILVIGSEVLSRITNAEDPDTAFLFGDGAGAVILGEVPAGFGLLGSDLGVDGTGFDVLKIPAGGSRMPASAETVAQRLHYVAMDGYRVFMFAMRVLGDSVIRSLTMANCQPDDIDLLIPHQANLRIIDAAARRMNLPREKTAVYIDQYGNTSAASIPIALSEAVAAGRIKHGDCIALAGFGAGLAWGSCILKWS